MGRTEDVAPALLVKVAVGILRIVLATARGHPFLVRAQSLARALARPLCELAARVPVRRDIRLALRRGFEMPCFELPIVGSRHLVPPALLRLGLGASALPPLVFAARHFSRRMIVGRQLTATRLVV